jgi:hypothetical protein
MTIFIRLRYYQREEEGVHNRTVLGELHERADGRCVNRSPSL